MQADTHPYRRKAIISAALLVALALLVWIWLRFARDTKPPVRQVAAVQVTTTKVKQQDVAVSRTGVGTVTALQSVTVKPRIDGQLVRVGFVEGLRIGGRRGRRAPHRVRR